MGRGRLGREHRGGRGAGGAGWLAAIAITIALMAGMPAGARAADGAVVTVPQLNLRAEPGLWAPVVAQVGQGERLALLAGPTADGWYTVTLFEGEVAVATSWAAMGRDPSDDGFFATAVGTYYVYEKYGALSWTDWGGAWVRDWVGFDAARRNGFHTYLMDAAGQVLPGGDGPTGGCVALAPAAADQLFAVVTVGTRVEVHW